MSTSLKQLIDPLVVHRMSKLAVVIAMTVLFALITFGNVTDYGANFAFVRHVLTMDTLPAGASIRYRAVIDPAWHHAGYVIIILTEALITALGTWGGVRMAGALTAAPHAFARAKAPAQLAVALAYLLTQVGIFAIGNEWFGMWMSREWNGVESVFRLVMMTLGALIFVSLE